MRPMDNQDGSSNGRLEESSSVAFNSFKKSELKIPSFVAFRLRSNSINTVCGFFVDSVSSIFSSSKTGVDNLKETKL